MLNMNACKNLILIIRRIEIPTHSLMCLHAWNNFLLWKPKKKEKRQRYDIGGSELADVDGFELDPYAGLFFPWTIYHSLSVLFLCWFPFCPPPPLFPVFKAAKFLHLKNLSLQDRIYVGKKNASFKFLHKQRFKLSPKKMQRIKCETPKKNAMLQIFGAIPDFWYSFHIFFYFWYSIHIFSKKMWNEYQK